MGSSKDAEVVGHDIAGTNPISYTSSLSQLMLGDLQLISDILLYFPATLPGVLQPFWSLDVQDELCLLNVGNVRSLLLHIFLIPTQLGFLFSLFYLVIFPIPVTIYVVGIFGALVLNAWFCTLLNGDGSPVVSTTDLSSFARHDDEVWIFINGVSVGRQWLQANLNVLSLIFGRKFIGIHNPTYGIIFDLLECIIQRDCNFVTDDIRKGYAQVKASLLDPDNRKVVLVAHSQGGIEASAILDWLLDDLPSDTIGKLEVYTFGSAANHFNNPQRSAATWQFDGRKGVKTKSGVVGHIEHYTNSGEFVSRFGILGFVSLPPGSSVQDQDEDNRLKALSSERLFKCQHNRFSGVLFNYNSQGHMLNQHYLAKMFEREPYTLPDGSVGKRVADSNDFIDSEVSPWDGKKEGKSWGWPWQGGNIQQPEWTSMVLENGTDLGAVALANRRDRPLRPKMISRLWQYRNGMSPKDDIEDTSSGEDPTANEKNTIDEGQQNGTRLIDR